MGVLTEGYTHQILFIISLPLVMCPRTLQLLVSIFLCEERVDIQSTQNQSVDSISASRTKRSNRYLRTRTLERRSENETTFVKWKPQGRGKNHSCSALWWWHLLWSNAAGNLLNFSVSCGERYVALPTCELTFVSSILLSNLLAHVCGTRTP